MFKYKYILWGLIKHKYYIFLAGMYLNVGLWQLFVHDLDKLLPPELIGYAEGFADKDIAKLDLAWLYHQNRSKHHWEYWISRSAHKKGNGTIVLDMPEKYIREMIADFLAAEKQYSGDWSMQEWLSTNLNKMVLSPSTRTRLMKLLEDYGLYENYRTRI